MSNTSFNQDEGSVQTGSSLPGAAEKRSDEKFRERSNNLDAQAQSSGDWTQEKDLFLNQVQQRLENPTDHIRKENQNGQNGTSLAAFDTADIDFMDALDENFTTFDDMLTMTNPKKTTVFAENNIQHPQSMGHYQLQSQSQHEQQQYQYQQQQHHLQQRQQHGTTPPLPPRPPSRPTSPQLWQQHQEVQHNLPQPSFQSSVPQYAHPTMQHTHTAESPLHQSIANHLPPHGYQQQIQTQYTQPPPQHQLHGQLPARPTPSYQSLGIVQGQNQAPVPMQAQYARPIQPATVLVPVARNPDGPPMHINVQAAEQMDPSVVNSGMFQRVAFAQLSLRERLAPATSTLPPMAGPGGGLYPAPVTIPGPPPAPTPLMTQYRAVPPVAMNSMGKFNTNVNPSGLVAVPVAVPAPVSTPLPYEYPYPQASSPTFSDDFRMNMPSTDNSDIDIDEAMFEDWMEDDGGKLEYVAADIDVPCCASTYQWAQQGCSTIGHHVDAGCFAGSSSRSFPGNSSRDIPVQSPMMHGSQKSQGGFFASISSAICGPQKSDLRFDVDQRTGRFDPKSSNFAPNPSHMVPQRR